MIYLISKVWLVRRVVVGDHAGRRGGKGSADTGWSVYLKLIRPLDVYSVNCCQSRKEFYKRDMLNKEVLVLWF